MCAQDNKHLGVFLVCLLAAFPHHRWALCPGASSLSFCPHASQANLATCCSASPLGRLPHFVPAPELWAWERQGGHQCLIQLKEEKPFALLPSTSLPPLPRLMQWPFGTTLFIPDPAFYCTWINTVYWCCEGEIFFLFWKSTKMLKKNNNV